jgi:hypothetical protein
MAQIIGLKDWDSSGRLGASPSTAQLPKPELSAMEVIGLLTNMIGKVQAGKKENNQDLAWREAAKAELGVELPTGMGKLYPEMVQKKFEAGLDPEKKLYESLLSGTDKPISPTDTTDFSVMPGTQPTAAPVDGMGIDKSKLLRGLLSKKFGVPYEQMMTPEEKAQGLSDKRAEKLQDIEIKSFVSPQKRKDDLQKAELAAQSLNYMKDKAQNLPSGGAAIGGNIANFISRGSFNPQLALYEKQMPAMSVTIYREITGDTRLSDQDAEARALPLLWDPRKGEAGAIKEGVFNDLSKMYQARINLIKKGMYKPNPKDPAEMITPIEDVMAEAKKMNDVVNPEIQSKIQKAKAAGYSDEEIQAYLSGGK